MSEATRLRAQKAYSTDPEYLERMALAEEARVASASGKQWDGTLAPEPGALGLEFDERGRPYVKSTKELR